ncbi:MAG: LPS export ABC transporter periplasmic protein LptC [Proteobacteria bacterium]|nr:LPS export ABC transporter periplasmic protein LptC [Pseudomonadota bacterium]MBU1138136.1 LPS export ABC transporter periplasmic protein LptC [Pseudomonadota bacterium]MBU1231981.1 LPS export ABC transporter periplasmic protein LptC [Pseudomonadota bacterium]MBU1418157.1 LPS export ABC transporter periplasmic protein LptC [Pseudomonadota bacterium]MBU1456738.1 LPS export ABC transporter periplasmic protein LptC [Pseudomonadota bacterium]
MTSSRTLVWLIPLALLLTFPLWRIPIAAFLSPRGGYDPSLAERPVDEHKFDMETVHITQSEQGKTSLEIVAEKAYTGGSVNEVRMDNVDAVVTGNNAEQTFITARHGVLNKQEAVLTMIDEVVVIKPKDKMELYTDLLIYNDKTNMAHSPGKTRLVGDQITIRGNNLLFNTKTQSYDLGGRVHCKLTGFSNP